MDYCPFLIVVGNLFLLFGLLFLRHRISFIRSGIETDATVIRIEVSINKSEDADNTKYIPHFKFTTHDEKEIIFVHGTSGKWGKWSIGDQIKVVYNDAFPYDMMVRTFWGTYGRSVILLSIAFLLIGGGICYYLIQ